MHKKCVVNYWASTTLSRFPPVIASTCLLSNLPPSRCCATSSFSSTSGFHCLSSSVIDQETPVSKFNIPQYTSDDSPMSPPPSFAVTPRHNQQQPAYASIHFIIYVHNALLSYHKLHGLCDRSTGVLISPDLISRM